MSIIIILVVTQPLVHGVFVRPAGSVVQCGHTGPGMSGHPRVPRNLRRGDGLYHPRQQGQSLQDGHHYDHPWPISRELLF